MTQASGGVGETASPDVKKLQVVAYGADLWVTGTIASVQWRLSDTLNMGDDEHVQLHNAVVRYGYDSGATPVRVAQALVRADDLLLLAPLEEGAGTAQAVDYADISVERRARRVRAEVGPYAVEGDVHLSPDVEVQQHLSNRGIRFLPFTNAVVTSRSPQLPDGPAPFLLVNRAGIRLLLAVDDIGQPPEYSDLERMGSEATINARRAAEVLLSSRVFQGVELEAMESMCRDLLHGGTLTYQEVHPFDRVVHQGETADALFVVDYGELQVTRGPLRGGVGPEPVRLGPGDVFGERAILGHQRSASVTAVTEAAVLMLSSSGTRLLLRRFPDATRRLMSLMVQRR